MLFLSVTPDTNQGDWKWNIVKRVVRRNILKEKNTNNTAETGIINWAPMEIYETLCKMYAYGYLSWR